VPPIVAVLVTVLGAILLGSFAPVLGLALVGFLVLTGVVLPLASRRLSREPAGALVATRAALGAMLVDEIRGIADLVAFDEGDRHRARVLAIGRELDRTGERLAVARGLTTALSALFTSLAGVTVLAIAIPLVTGARLDGVFLALVPLAAMACFEAVAPLSLSVQLLDGTEKAAARLFELVDATPEVTDPPVLEAADPPVPAALPTSHEIEVRGLRFRYGIDEPYVLDGLDLTVRDGGSVALVGPSGSGKSTLVSLLLRFWDYREGEIRIGGRDLHDYRVEDVRRMLGVVSQQVHLFNATIRDNLAVADADATDERMEAACRMAQLHDTIVALPDGYQTRIGENGVRLSGGERQRLAIARAILKDAPILVLDEATANLDVLTERRLLESIAPFMAGRTTLVISHREIVAERVDGVVVMDAGRAAARATSPRRSPP